MKSHSPSDEQTWDPPGLHVALIFGHEHIVETDALKARIAIKGRALAIVDQENDSYVIDGVNPGGISVMAKSKDDAERQFRQSLNEILSDIAESSSTIDDLREQVDDFMSTSDDLTISEWQAARRAPLVETIGFEYLQPSARPRNHASVREVPDFVYAAGALA